MGLVNRLTLIQEKVKRKGKNWQGLYRCDCGIEKLIYDYNVKNGITNSCGCIHKEQLKPHFTRRTHSKSRSRVYRIWGSMISRCSYKKAKGYERYGGRGIQVCNRWLKFENFFADMGDPPGKEYSLDRINNNLNYEPSNCRWATRLQQANNKRTSVLITYQGKTQTLSQWAQELKIHKATLTSRLKTRNWSIEKALSTIPKKGK